MANLIMEELTQLQKLHQELYKLTVMGKSIQLQVEAVKLNIQVFMREHGMDSFVGELGSLSYTPAGTTESFSKERFFNLLLTKARVSATLLAKLRAEATEKNPRKEYVRFTPIKEDTDES